MDSEARLTGASGFISMNGHIYEGVLYVEPGTLLVRWRPKGDRPVPPELQGAETPSEGRAEGE